MIDNDITIDIYDGTTRVLDISNDLEYAEAIQFATHIPGGDYGEASFFVERDVTKPFLFKIGDRVTYTNSQTVVYEGFISGINRIIETDYQGVEFLLSGGTDWILMKYPLEKWWADNRIDEVAWREYVESSHADSITDLMNVDVDRNGRIRFTPKNVAFAANKFHTLIYEPPTGQVVKRIKFDYDFAEAAQNWRMAVLDDALNVEWSVTADGSGSADTTLSGDSANLQLIFQSLASQTPTDDGTIYGEISSVVVYSETDDPITMTTIAGDIAAELNSAGYLNSSSVMIDTPASELTLEPFITNGYPSVADILNDAVSRGDGAYNRWVWGIRNSEAVPTANGWPVLYVEQYPATTDWEYEISFGENNIAAGIEIEQDGLAIANHIITSRTNASGRYVYQTPADDANLADATSKTDYGILSGVRLDAGNCEQAEATAYARRFLASYADPPFKLLRPLVLVDYIRRKDGSEQPVRLIRPGERVKLTNFVSTISGVEPVFVITAVSHTIDDEGVSLTTGLPGAPIGARQVVWPVSADPGNATGSKSTIAAGTSSTSGNKQRRDWYIDYARVHGISVSEAQKIWQGMALSDRVNWKKTTLKNWRSKETQKKLYQAKKARQAARAKKSG